MRAIPNPVLVGWLVITSACGGSRDFSPEDENGSPDARVAETPDAGGEVTPDAKWPEPDQDLSDGCVPRTCVQAGASCGAVPDACGGILDCGTCPSGEVCGGVGVPNHCVAPDGGAGDAVAPAACSPGTRECVELRVRVCDDAGVWQDAETCTDSCVQGVCQVPQPPAELVGYRIRMYNWDCDSQQHYWGWSQTPGSDSVAFESAPGSSYAGTSTDRTIFLQGHDGDASFFVYDVIFPVPEAVHGVSCSTQHLGGNHTFACGERLEFLYSDGSVGPIPSLVCTPTTGFHYGSDPSVREQSCSW